MCGVLLHVTPGRSTIGSKPTYRELVLWKESKLACKDFPSVATKSPPYVLLRYELSCFDDMDINFLLQSDIYTHLLNVMRDKLTYYCMLHHVSFHRSLNPYSCFKKRNRLLKLFYSTKVVFKRNNPKDFLPLKLCTECINDDEESISQEERTFICKLIEGLEDHIGFLLTIKNFNAISTEVKKAVELHKVNFRYVTVMICSDGEIVGIDRNVVDLMLPHKYRKDSDYNDIRNDVLLKSYGIQYIISDFYIKYDKMMESRCIPVTSNRGAYVLVFNWYSTITLTVEYDFKQEFLLIKY